MKGVERMGARGQASARAYMAFQSLLANIAVLVLQSCGFMLLWMPGESRDSVQMFDLEGFRKH